MKGKQIGAFVVLGGGLGLLWLFAKKGIISVAAQPVTTTPPPPPVVPAAPASTGPTTQQVVGAVVGTSTTIAGIIAGAGAPAAAVIAPAAAAPVIAAAPAAGVAVGGSATAGSVAAGSSAAVGANAATPAGAAASGGSSGIVSFFTNPITIAIGATLLVAGLIIRARRNETKEDREDFALSLGFFDEVPTMFFKSNDPAYAQHDGVKWFRSGSLDKLFAALAQVNPEAEPALRNESANIIGKHDKTGNIAWMHKVLRAFGLEDAATPTGPAAGAIQVYDTPFEDEETDKFDDELLQMEL